MAYFNGKKISFSPKLLVIEGYDRGYADGYAKGSADRHAVMGAILDRSIVELTADDLKCITEIGKYAFYYCDELVSVTIPNGIEKIGDNAFSLCHKLSRASIAGGVKTIGSSAFFYAPLTVLDIQDGVEVIRDNAFNYCSKLTNVIIPRSVKRMNKNALKIGSSSDKATITMLGETPPTIQSDTFYADYLKDIIVPLNSVDAYLSATNWSNFADYIFCVLKAEDFDGVTSIANNMYLSETRLIKVELSDSVKTIGNNAFRDCTNLESIFIPEGVTIVGDYAFQNCKALKEVTIPESVAGAELGKYAFYECEALEEVTLPSKLTKIRGCCFLGCVDLKKVTIPEGVILIGGHAFYKCESLRELTLPESVKYLEENSLGIGTPENKATVIMKSKTPPPISTTNIFRTDCVEKIVVPTGCGAVYRSATNWSLIADDIEIEEEEE